MDYEKEYKDALARMELCVRIGLKITPEYIFPELRESEDERIRKELVQFLTEIKNISEGGRDSWHVRKEDAKMCTDFLAYLEKQKESLHISETYKENADSFTSEDEKIRKEIRDFLIDMECRKEWITYLEKQKEQKEIPLMNGDADLYFDNWIQHNDTTKRGCFEEGIRYAQRLQKEQKPVEWSEADEKIRQSLILLVSNDNTNGYTEFYKAQEITCDKVIAFLKSLRPSWKPSEEQMEALEYVIRDYREDGCNATANYLQEILDHLKNM